MESFYPGKVIKETLAAALLLSAFSSSDVALGGSHPQTRTPPASAHRKAPDTRDSASSTPYADKIDPMIGTGGIGWGVGSILPGATRPYGMVKLSPDTSRGELAPEFAHCAGYWYPDTHIRGFTHNHLSGTGAADQGNILVMPLNGMGDYLTTEDGYRSTFDHSTEVAEPGYYRVRLEAFGIDAELTATDHVGFHRYTFPALLEATVLIDVSAVMRGSTSSDVSFRISPEAQEVTGTMTNHGSLSARYGGQPIFFVARFKEPFVDYGSFSEGRSYPGYTSSDGDNAGAYVQFETTEGQTIELAVGISYVSIAQARVNLEAELGDWDFDVIRAEAKAAWEKAVSVLEVEGGTAAEQRSFYTALYHTMMMPTRYTDVNGVYMGFDKQPHTASSFTYFTDLSLWDTFRTLHPLLSLISPNVQADCINSMMKMAEQGGYVDRWPQGNGPTGCMLGDSPVMVVADAVAKGVTGFDEALAYETLRRQATLDDPSAWHRPNLAPYLETQYMAMETTGESVSETLEYVYADGAMSLLARALGEETDEAMFFDRAMFYQNHYNPETGFLQGRYEDGTFLDPFYPYYSADQYVEGNAYHWTWYVPLDMAGLIELFGGERATEHRLDELFRRSRIHRDTLFPDLEYWHGNEPDLHVSYMYNWVGRPDKTQETVRWVMETKYNDSPAGLDGNDDGGTLSAWYVFSAMGFYPIAGTDLYLIGSPLFERAVLHLPHGDFTIEAAGASSSQLYVQSARLNGVALNQAWFRHADLRAGGSLTLTMGSQPSSWARDGARPPSLSQGL